MVGAEQQSRKQENGMASQADLDLTSVTHIHCTINQLYFIGILGHLYRKINVITLPTLSCLIVPIFSVNAVASFPCEHGSFNFLPLPPVFPSLPPSPVRLALHRFVLPFSLSLGENRAGKKEWKMVLYFSL